MKKKIDKTVFVHLLEHFFESHIEKVVRICQREIEGRRTRMDKPSFVTWLMEEREILLNDPHLKVFDIVLYVSMNTTHSAAQNLADLMELDSVSRRIFGLESSQINWGNAWQMAQRVLAGLPPDEKENKVFKGSVHTYLKAVDAAEKAKVFTQFIEALSAPTVTNLNEKRLVDLKPLAEVVKDAPTFLPKLWEALAGMPAPLVSKSGTFIWSGENVSVLMALAQALKTAEKVLGNYTTEQVYRILCRHFKAPEATRPRIKANTGTGFTNVYTDHLTAFNDTLQGL